MTQRQRNSNQEQRNRQGGDDSGPEFTADVDFDAMRDDANRLFAIVDRTYDRIRSVNSEDHLLHNQQRGGQ